MTVNAAPPISVSLCYGWLEIDSHSLNTVAWNAVDLSPLYGTPELRGSDVVLPGAPGVKPRRRRQTVTRLSLEFVVVGSVASNGTPYGDPYVGFETNLAYLHANVLDPTNVGDGTRSIVWHKPSGATVTADCHVLGYRPQLHPGAIGTGTLELELPGGDLHL